MKEKRLRIAHGGGRSVVLPHLIETSGGQGWTVECRGRRRGCCWLGRWARVGQAGDEDDRSVGIKGMFGFHKSGDLLSQVTEN